MRLCDAMARARRAAGGAGPADDAEGAPPLRRIHSRLTRLLEIVEEADALPTPAVRKAVDETIAALDGLLARQEEKR
jgi:hypothetical protein